MGRGRGLIDSVIAAQQAGVPLFFSPPPICSQGLLIETGGQEERGSWRKRAGRRGDPSSQPAITEFKPLFHDFFSVK